MGEEFNPGVSRSISLRRGKKKDGTNWVMFAGGAIAMAVSVAFGRKKMVDEVAEAKETLISSESGRFQVLQQEDDENGSLQTSETVPNGALQWDITQLASPSTEAAFEFRSFKSKRPAQSDHSPSVTKFLRQSPATPEITKEEVIQSDSQIIPSTLQSGVISRRSEVVSKLRHQINSRDAIIYDLQTQLADQDQMIVMHRNHSVDLQNCVRAISTKLFEANLEIQRLQQELMAQHAKPIVDLDEEFIGYAVSEIKRQWVQPDVEEIILEARKFNKELEHLRREKEDKSRQCDLLSKRLSALTTELEEVKTAAHGKQRLLEAKEQEYLKLANVVQDLERKLEIEARDNEWLLMALYAVSGKGQGNPGMEYECETYHEMGRCS
ncbi:hypothetical protein M758_6G179700 [Ceratodon purpureus]|nr:hypothetical protein M758_6G179700 [Ceratodon purpureus]